MLDIICVCHLRWDFVWQRPQHLISRLAKRHRVLFVEEPLPVAWGSEPRLEIRSEYWHSLPSVTVARLLQPNAEREGITHGDPQCQSAYEDLLAAYVRKERYHNVLLWLYTPMASDFTQVIPHDLLVYDVMDQLSAFKNAPADIAQREKALLRKADVVFTGGVSLYRDKAPYNPNTHVFPSGVDVEHYAQATRRGTLPTPPELADIPRPLLGYFGVIDERMDLDLIASIAAARPDWQLAMIGPVVKIDPADLPQAPNIHYLGMKGYAELPAYLAQFDVALIPFALNEATRFVSPTKTLEYMAAHKPVVSTPIHDVVELYGGVVRVGRTADEFIAHVARALDERGDAARYAKEQLLLSENTWDSTLNRMVKIIDSTAARKTAHTNGASSSANLQAVQRAAGD